jgi:uncharacterized protein YktB (UPF0637 family)
MNKNKTQVTVSLLNDQLAFIDNLANQQAVSRGHAVRQIIKEMMNDDLSSSFNASGSTVRAPTAHEQVLRNVNYLQSECFKLLSVIKGLESRVNHIEESINVK